MAEDFRDDEHRDVLLLDDNVFRFTQARRGIGGCLLVEYFPLYSLLRPRSALAPAGL